MKKSCFPSFRRIAPAALLPIVSLLVASEIQLKDPAWSGSRFSFEVSGPAGNSYHIDASTNLVDWTRLFSSNAIAGSWRFTDPTSSPSDRRFYRVSSTTTAQPDVELRFLSPTPESILSTNRPTLQLELSGSAWNTNSLQLRANDVQLPVTCVWSGNQVHCTPENPLPAGFLRFTATVADVNGVRSRQARLETVLLDPDRNLAPRAIDDVVYVSASGENTRIFVLENDRDPEGASLSLSTVSAPEHGTATLDGSAIVYLPAPGFSGDDTFTYSVSDPRGATSSGLVHVTVRPAADLVASVVPQPAQEAQGAAGSSGNRQIQSAAAAGLEFNNLEAAIDYLVQHLAENQRGKIVLRAGAPIRVSKLYLAKNIELSSEEGAVLEGETVTLDLAADASLIGLTFIASTAVIINIGADVDLIQNHFLAPAHLRLTTPGALQPAQLAALTAAATHHVNAGGNVFAGGVRFSGAATGDSRVHLHRGPALFVEGNVVGEANALFKVDAIDTSDVKLSGVFEGASRWEAKNLSGLELFQNELEFKSNNRMAVHSVATARGEISVRGVGEGEISATALRADELEYRLGSGKIAHRGTNNIYGIARFHITPLNGTVEAHVQEDSTEFTGKTTLLSDEDTVVTVQMKHARFQEKLDATSLGGRATYELLDEVVLGAGASLTAQGDSLQAQFQNVTAQGELFIDALGVVEAGVHISDSKIQGGGIRVNVDRLLGLGAEVWNPQFSTEPPIRLFATAEETNRITLRNLEITGAAAPAGVIPIQIATVDQPVDIDHCRIATSAEWAIQLQEIDAPINIRGNELSGAGIQIDGDLQGTGRTGLIPHPALISSNVISGGMMLHGITIDDLRQAVLQANSVTAETPLIVTSAHVTADNNEFTTVGEDGIGAVGAASGSNGPGIIVASKNRITASVETPSLVSLGIGGYGRFTENQFNGPGVVIGGTGAEPGYGIFEQNVFAGETGFGIGPHGFLRLSGNRFGVGYLVDDNPTGGLVSNPANNPGLDPEDIISLVDFNGNGCQDYPPECDSKDPETGECDCELDLPAVPPPSAPPWPVL